MQMRRTRVRVFAAAAVLALTAAGAAYAGTALQSGKVKVIAIATPAQTNDYGWNQQGVNSAKAAGAAFGAKVNAVTNIGYDKTDVVLEQLAKSGANFIIAHASGYDTVAARIAQQYKVPIMTYDIPTMLTKGYVSNITTQSQESSYLAGILAALAGMNGATGSSPAGWDGWSDSEVDALLDQGRATTDLATRQQIYTQTQQMLCDKVAAFWSYAATHVDVATQQLQGFKPHPTTTLIGLATATLAG